MPKNFTGTLIILYILSLTSANAQNQPGYPIIDTGQELCYDTLNSIPDPLPGEPYYGQDAQFNGIQPSYNDNGDGTVSDLNTGLIWQKHLFSVKYTYSQAVSAADTFSLGGYNDWRLPSIKELYSLIDFSGMTGMSAAESVPYLDTSYFDFRYGNENNGERFIDAQYISSTEYVGTTMMGNFTVFGVNFADGRIKGYPAEPVNGIDKKFEVRFVRGNSSYGINDFTDNNDGTITDNATGLIWSKSDNGEAVRWDEALAYVYQKNQDNYLGRSDWRLPNAKELQSIVDYTRSPQTTGSAAINPVFNVTSIIDEGGNTNFPFYWTGTTHADGNPENLYAKAVYVAFGEALGFMEVPPNSGNYVLMDVHGTGAQRSDPKFGDPDNFPYGFGPQGDVIRIFNYVRMVRSGSETGNEEGKLETPEKFELYQNYPNPFNPSTILSFSVGKTANVTLNVYNALGKEVVQLENNNFSPGFYTAEFDATNLSSGVYFYQLKAEGFTVTKKMVLLR